MLADFGKRSGCKVEEINLSSFAGASGGFPRSLSEAEFSPCARGSRPAVRRDECKKQGSAIIKKVSVTSLTLAKSVAKFASDKKAENIVLLDMRRIANFCDFFVLGTGSSDRQVRAIALGIDEGAEQLGSKIGRKQGMKDGRWVVLDMGSVVAHIFDHETREFYGLEYLWQEAKRIKWET